MAWDDDYFVPASWSDRQASLYDELVGGDPVIAGDANLRFLYQEALYDLDLRPYEREIVLEALEDYLMQEYGINFDDIFDWEGYRAWYENA
jgi:hypothetical protein